MAKDKEILKLKTGYFLLILSKINKISILNNNKKINL